MRFQRPDADPYDRLERAIIALEYALADARLEAAKASGDDNLGVSRAQEALQQAGEEVVEILADLRSEALQTAAANARVLSEATRLESDPAPV